jgi:hypothetical protein
MTNDGGGGDDDDDDDSNSRVMRQTNVTKVFMNRKS